MVQRITTFMKLLNPTILSHTHTHTHTQHKMWRPEDGRIAERRIRHMKDQVRMASAGKSFLI